MLPPGFKRKVITFISSTQHEQDISSLPREQRNVLEVVDQQGRVSLRQIEKTLGKKRAQTITSQLMGRGLVVRSYELEGVKVKPKKLPFFKCGLELKERVDQ